MPAVPVPDDDEWLEPDDEPDDEDLEDDDMEIDALEDWDQDELAGEDELDDEPV